MDIYQIARLEYDIFVKILSNDFDINAKYKDNDLTLTHILIGNIRDLDKIHFVLHKFKNIDVSSSGGPLNRTVFYGLVSWCNDLNVTAAEPVVRKLVELDPFGFAIRHVDNTGLTALQVIEEKLNKMCIDGNYDSIYLSNMQKVYEIMKEHEQETTFF